MEGVDFKHLTVTVREPTRLSKVSELGNADSVRHADYQLEALVSRRLRTVILKLVRMG